MIIVDENKLTYGALSAIFQSYNIPYELDGTEMCDEDIEEKMRKGLKILREKEQYTLFKRVGRSL